MSDSVIYTRVSSEKQKREGNGSSSQEQRCRSFIEMQGYRLLKVFGDEAISGAVLNRPGMKELLSFLRSRRGSEPIMVVVDDISRLARDVKTHIELRATIQACGGKLVSPSFNFEENAIGQFMETIFAGMAQYGRAGNREQVLNRQRARLEQGFWTFPTPPGYAFQRHPTYKKLPVPNRVQAALVKEALEGFADGRFRTQRDMARHLKRRGFFGEQAKRYLCSYDMKVRRILDSRSFYAGYVEYAPWGVERRRAMHEPIISTDTLAAIEERLAGNMPRPIREDNREDFWLRNWVRCPECSRPLTASMARGRYPRYHCYGKDCRRYGQTITRDRLHQDFERLLKSLKASDGFMKLVKKVTADLWQQRVRQWDQEAHSQELQIAAATQEISALMKRIGKTEDEALVAEYEREVKEQRGARQEAERVLEKHRQGPPNYEEARGRVGTLLQNPYLLWKLGDRQQKRTVVDRIFTTAPTYDRESGFGTIELSVPYQISQGYMEPESRMVEVARVALASKTAGMAVLHAQFPSILKREKRNDSSP